MLFRVGEGCLGAGDPPFSLQGDYDHFHLISIQLNYTSILELYIPYPVFQLSGNHQYLHIRLKQYTLNEPLLPPAKMTIAHVSLPVSSLSASKSFYLSALKPLGYGIFMELEATVGMKKVMAAPDFWFHACPKAEKEEGGGEKKGGRMHVALEAKSQKQVQEFYSAAL